MVPPREPVEGAAFVTTRSARLTMLALTLALLLTGLRSVTPAGAAIVAVFRSVPAAFAGNVPVTLNVAEDCAGSETADESGSVPDGGLQLPPEGAEQVHVTFVSAGVVPVSVTSAPLTGLGPAFRTTIWYVTGPPATTVPSNVLVIVRSATVTAVVTVDSLAPGRAGCPGQLTKSNVHRARFTRLDCPGAIASTCALKVTVALVPATMVPSGTPAARSAAGCATPFNVKLLATNDVPVASVSKKTTLA